MGGDLFTRRRSRERTKSEQCLGGRGAVELPIGEGRAAERSLRSTVVGIQVGDDRRSQLTQRQRPVLGDAVRVTQVGQHVGERDA